MTMDLYFVCQGHTLAANAHGGHHLMHRSFGEGERVTPEYLVAIEQDEPGRLAVLVAAGTLRREKTGDPAPAGKRRLVHRVAAGHSLNLKDGTVLPEHTKLDPEHLADLHENRLLQLVENGTLVEHDIADDEEEIG